MLFTPFAPRYLMTVWRSCHNRLRGGGRLMFRHGLLTLAALAWPAALLADAPSLRKQGRATQLIVNGKPHLIIGGELSNSASSSAAYMAPHWPRLKAMHLNTVLAPVSWELIEPVEGQYDWTSVDTMLTAARANDLKLVVLWFGAWKNSMSTYVPA
ncbi:MAG TPA: beta-galactosidase, partial [Sphingomonas sp.]|nr:beta-galactosidase [Sphingomonas sp.]